MGTNRKRSDEAPHLPTARHKVLFYGGCFIFAVSLFFQILLAAIGIISRSFELFLLMPLAFMMIGVLAIWASGADVKTARRAIADMFLVFPY